MTENNSDLIAAINALDNRMAARQEQDRADRRRLIEAERQRIAADRLADQAADLDAYRKQRVRQAVAAGDLASELADVVYGTSRAAIDSSVSALTAKSAALGLTRRAPATAPAPESATPEPEQIDPATMSMAQYTAWRATSGMDQRGDANIGRRPGSERESIQLSPGNVHVRGDQVFPDWRDHLTSRPDLRR